MHVNAVPAPHLRRLYLLLCLLTCGLLGLLVSLRWVETIDDAYIFFRYAHNIASGHGYTFNAGVPIEGTTSVIWTLMLSLLDYLGYSLEWGGKVLGFITLLGIIALLYYQFYKWGVSIGIVAILSALLITNERFTLSAMLGLETGLFALLLVALFLVADIRGSQRSSAAALGVIGVLLYLTRPETIALMLLLAVGFLIFRPFNRTNALITIIIWVAGLLLATVWRLGVFGDFIPNSARAKSIIGFSALQYAILWGRVSAGISYTMDWLRASWLIVIPGIFGLIPLWRRHAFQGFVALSILLLGITVVIMNAGDWMPLSRLLTPYLPVLVALAGFGCQIWLGAVGQRWRSVFNTALAALAIILVATALWPLRGKEFFVADKWSSGICYGKIAEVLQPYLSKDTMLAPEAIGMIGYRLPDVPILDIFGLTDPYIARHGVIPQPTFTSGKHHYQYVMQQQPALFLFHSDLIHHIPYLNKWGYSEKYRTYRLRYRSCELYVGINETYAPEWVPALEQTFKVRPLDTVGMPENPFATWPMGER